MQVEALKVFCDVVRLRSFSKGALENNVTQSMASQTLNKLEKHLGVSLIDRSFRPWKLTPEGKVFYDGCRDVVERYFKLESELKHYHDERTSIVRISTIYSVGMRHMRQFVEDFHNAFPQARAHLEYSHPDKIYESVIQEDVDIGIVSFPQTRREIEVLPWKQEPMVLVVHNQHRFAELESVDLANISGESFVGFEKNLVIRREVDTFLRRNHINVDVVLEFDNIESIKRAVEIGSGIAILPRPSMEREIINKSLVAINFAKRELIRPLGIIHRRGRKFNANVAHFIDMLKENPSPDFADTPLI